MAYDEGVAQRVREYFTDRTDITEKKMFGGLAFLVSGHMCVGVINDELMARVGPEQYPAALQEPHAREMDFTGRPMKGFVYIGAEGYNDDHDLQSWIHRCEKFVSTLEPK